MDESKVKEMDEFFVKNLRNDVCDSFKKSIESPEKTIRSKSFIDPKSFSIEKTKFIVYKDNIVSASKNFMNAFKLSAEKLNTNIRKQLRRRATSVVFCEKNEVLNIEMQKINRKKNNYENDLLEKKFQPFCKYIRFSTVVLEIEKMDISDKKIEIEQYDIKDAFKSLFYPMIVPLWDIKTQIKLLKIFEFSKLKYEEKNYLHISLVLTVWKALYDITATNASTIWQQIGFNSSDPNENLKNSGLYGLVNMLYFAQSYSEDMRKIYGLSLIPSCNFNFGNTSVLISKILLVTLEKGMLNRLLNKTQDIHILINKIYVLLYQHFIELYKEKKMVSEEFFNCMKQTELYLQKHSKTIYKALIKKNCN